MGRNGVDVGVTKPIVAYVCHLRATTVFSTEIFDFGTLCTIPFIAVRNAGVGELRNPECMYCVWVGGGGGGGGRLSDLL